MRVAFISFDFGEYSVRHANALADAGAEVLLVLPSNVAEEFRERLLPAVQPFWFRRPRFRQPLRNRKLAREILAEVRGFVPDVVHFQGGHLWFNFALPELRRFPLVLTVHNPRHHVGDKSSRRTPQWVMDYGYRQADSIIVHGETLREQVIAAFPKFQDRVEVVQHIAMGDPAQTQHIETDPNLVLFLGRIWEYKGLAYLIRAVPLIAEKVPDVRVMIAGEGDEFSKYEALMQERDRFIVHNRRVSNAEREVFFAQSAVVALPYISATQSGVIPIAYAHAKPVVCTAVGSLPEVVEHNKTGLVVKPCDERGLANAIVELLQDEAKRTALGARGREKLDAECGPAVVAQSHLDVYARTIALRSPATNPTAGSSLASKKKYHLGANSQ